MKTYLTLKELAAALGKSVSYVFAMKKAGFTEEFPRHYSYEKAVQWLKDNPNFRTHRAYPSKARRRDSGKKPLQHIATNCNESHMDAPIAERLA